LKSQIAYGKSDTDYKNLSESASIKLQMAKEIGDHHHHMRHHFSEHLLHHGNRINDHHNDHTRRAEFHTRDIMLQAANNKAALELQAANNRYSVELQAANYKAQLENHITKTSGDGILKTVETTSRIMEKLMECCCENKMGHQESQKIIIQNTNNNTNIMQQNEITRLQQLVSQTQYDALLAKMQAGKQ
jgi:acyl transferase domain-containing protein